MQLRRGHSILTGTTHQAAMSGILPRMLALLRTLLSLFQTQHSLTLENPALRQQLAIFKQKLPRPRLRVWDRVFWSALCATWSEWASALLIVQPRTVVRWHRAGFRLFWRWKSRHRRIDPQGDVRALARTMARENSTWGAPRIHAELLKLGFVVSERTVSRWIPRRPPLPGAAQNWRTFLRNHRDLSLIHI